MSAIDAQIVAVLGPDSHGNTLLIARPSVALVEARRRRNEI